MPNGVDICIKELGVNSTGKVFSNPKADRRLSKSLKRSQRRVSKKAQDSKNRVKALKKLARIIFLHLQIVGISHKSLSKLLVK